MSVLLIKITATPHHLRPPGQMNIHPSLDVAHEYLWWLTPDMQMSQPTQMASDHTMIQHTCAQAHETH